MLPDLSSGKVQLHHACFLTSHQGKCSHTMHAAAESLVNTPSTPGSNYTTVLPTFEDACQLPCYTLHHVLAKARPMFARVLSTALRNAWHENTEESWLKLFMLLLTSWSLGTFLCLSPAGGSLTALMKDRSFPGHSPHY